jgi:hypothetical protein
VVGNWDKMLGNLTNSNGCPAPVTWFTTTDGTECALIKQLYAKGDEIADHTMSHPQIDAGASVAVRQKEIIGARTYLNETCGVPLERIAGYRSTFLVNNPGTREVN